MNKPLHDTCEGCGKAHSLLHAPLKGHFCPDCLKGIVLAKDAEHHLIWLLEDVLAAWWTTWGGVGLPQLERAEIIPEAAKKIAKGLHETEDEPEEQVAA